MTQLSATAKARRLGKVASVDRAGSDLPLISCSRIQMGNARGIWRVTKDGNFYGDFFKKQDAVVAALAARNAIVQPV